MSAAEPRTAEEWVTFFQFDSMPLVERLRFVANLANWELEHGDDHGEADWALHAIIPGDGQASLEMLDAVAEATGRPRIRQGENGVVNTAPAARVALRRWAARQ